MKNEPTLYNDYVLATLIGALIFTAGYFVRDFNTFNTDSYQPEYYDGENVSATIPPSPPGDVPAPPDFLSLGDAEDNVAAVEDGE